jgi:signal peptidase I
VKGKASASGSLLELVMIVVVALGLALGIQAFLVKPYRIPSESMVPTLEVGQRVLVNRIGARFSDPRPSSTTPAAADRRRRARLVAGRRPTRRTSTSSSALSRARATGWRSRMGAWC